uniref:SlyX family protein n=1 Tax=Schlesneria paludicola TaxID=360056 RepID=A0A7C2JWC5_9PLAN
MTAEDRLVAIETAVAHLQHDVEQLHQVLLALQSEVRTVTLALDKLVARVDRLNEPPEVRSPEAERPPHY